MNREEDKWSWMIMTLGKDIHIIPTDEYYDHFPNHCPCNPKTRELDNGCWEFAHKSWDGRREAMEKLLYKDKMGKTIYQGKRVHRFCKQDVERGDADWESWEQRQETVTPFRLFLDDVSTWEVYSDPYEPFDIQKTRQVLEVEVCTAGGRETCYIVEDLEVFDFLIEKLHDTEKESPSS